MADVNNDSVDHDQLVHKCNRSQQWFALNNKLLREAKAQNGKNESIIVLNQNKYNNGTFSTRIRVLFVDLIKRKETLLLLLLRKLLQLFSKITNPFLLFPTRNSQP